MTFTGGQRVINIISEWLRSNYLHDLIDCLATALDASDAYTAGHSSRVGDMSYELAKVMGIKGKQLMDIHIAAHLHDIGKIGIPETILNKKGKLFPHEWELIKSHSEIGYKILTKSKRLKKLAVIVLYHHERWNGTGYPEGLKEDRIPIGSRIIGLADAVDAMMSNRSYRQAMTWEVCCKEVKDNKGVQFDPLVVEAAEKLWIKWKEAYNYDLVTIDRSEELKHYWAVK